MEIPCDVDLRACGFELEFLLENIFDALNTREGIINQLDSLHHQDEPHVSCAAGTSPHVATNQTSCLQSVCQLIFEFFVKLRQKVYFEAIAKMWPK